MNYPKFEKQIKNLIGTLWDQESRKDGESTIEMLAKYAENLREQTKNIQKNYKRIFELEKQLALAKASLQNKIAVLLGEAEKIEESKPSTEEETKEDD